MPTNPGTAIRLARLINPTSGRGFCIAFDHALQLGPMPGLEQPERMLEAMAEAGVDGVILSPGTARRFGPALARRRGPAIILRLDQTTMWREGTPLAYRDGATRLIATVEDAVAAGADAVITYLFVAHNDPALETRAFEDNAAVNRAARAAGIPHIIETMAARGALAGDPFTRDAVALHTRIGAELGADILKTDWPGSIAGLRDIVAGLPVPVMLAGGPRQTSDFGSLELVAGIMQAGAAGILFGRAIFQARDPLAMMRACRAIIHDGRTAAEAAAAAGVSPGS